LFADNDLTRIALSNFPALEKKRPYRYARLPTETSNGLTRRATLPMFDTVDDIVAMRNRILDLPRARNGSRVFSLILTASTATSCVALTNAWFVAYTDILALLRNIQAMQLVDYRVVISFVCLHCNDNRCIHTLDDARANAEAPIDTHRLVTPSGYVLVDAERLFAELPSLQRPNLDADKIQRLADLYTSSAATTAADVEYALGEVKGQINSYMQYTDTLFNVQPMADYMNRLCDEAAVSSLFDWHRRGMQRFNTGSGIIIYREPKNSHVSRMF